MTIPRVHLIAPAGSCRPFFNALGLSTAAELVSLVQGTIGTDFQVTADLALLNAGEDERGGGRTDDQRRAADIESALFDDDVVGLVSLRGGAWFTRVLPRIDFSVLDRRTRPIFVFGFSELTTLVNIVGAHPCGVGIYAATPGFYVYGLKRYAATRAPAAHKTDLTPEEWMRERQPHEVEVFFKDVVAMIEGKPAEHAIVAEHVRGPEPEASTIAFIGGNLTVFSTLIGSHYAACIDPTGRWLLLEDFNDKPERFDRFLAHLTLAGFWDRCAGILLGDFHYNENDLKESVLAMLDYHLPPERKLPILSTGEVGHIWPAQPLPLHRPVTLRRRDDKTLAIEWSASSLRPSESKTAYSN